MSHFELGKYSVQIRCMSPPHFMHTLPFKKLIFEINSGFQHLTALKKWLKSIEKKNFGAT